MMNAHREIAAIDYDHSRNLHVLDGPKLVLPVVLRALRPKSILDVGCGTGTWLRTAMSVGMQDVFGIDGVEVPVEQMHVERSLISRINLNESWDLGRHFDVALCLEVAEHLPAASAPVLVGSLARHSNSIVFSAAVPGQQGQGHVNCQWPAYWQGLFNAVGYACFDEVRPLIWRFEIQEYWYKQNIFIARKDPERAGSEERIASLIHPDLYEQHCRRSRALTSVERGEAPLSEYVKLARAKLSRLLVR